MGKTTLFFYRQSNLSLILITLISIVFTNYANATVTFSKPAVSISTCSFPSSYSTLGNIVITEESNNDFSTGTNITLILTAPTNFQFNTSTSPNVNYQSGRNISSASAVVNSATQITITYTVGGTNRTDMLTIAGIQIRATAASAAVNITRTGGNGAISGLPNTTTLTNSLTSNLLTVPAQPTSISGNTAPCSGTSQTYSVTNVTGTTYNWSLPAGWSQTNGGTSNSIIVTPSSTSGTITVTPSNSCGSGTNRTLTVNPVATPTITNTTPNSRTGTGTVTLGATASVGTISWYADASGGSALSGATGTTNSTFITPSLSVSTTYYVESKNGSCTSLRTAVVATVYNSEINILGNATSIVDGTTIPNSSNWTDFGSVDVSSGTLIKKFTIQNTGNSVLTIGAITISGANASEFTVTSAPSSSIAAGSSSILEITFNPIALGTKQASISIENNDSNENPYDFTIQGEGIQSFFDSDADGVYDNIDVDDDNDGILDTTEETNCNIAGGNKVNYKFLNETFGAGTDRVRINTTYAATTTYSFQDATTATDVEGSGLSVDLNDGKYTVGSSAQIASWADVHWHKGGDHTGDANGRMAIFNASYTPGIFYTALITGALPNLPITYSFWVLNIDRSDAPGVATRLRPNIKVEFRDINDNILQTIETGNIEPTNAGNLNGDWYQFTANLNLNVTAFKVIFINNNTGGLGNDLALDDILITQTLCDRDNDGIADVFDLDADNDGIPDIVEVGLGTLSNGKAKIDVAWADANTNGLHDGAESAAALTALDSDGDGIPNYIDLDSDNDSVFDVDESGAGNSNTVATYINGDGDSSGDGVGDGPESETFRSKDTNGDLTIEGFGDGILDIYEYGTGVNQYGNSGQGNANPTYLKDTDGDGLPDYIDLQSTYVNTGISPSKPFGDINLAYPLDIAPNKLIYASLKNIDSDNDGIVGVSGVMTDIDKDGILDAFDTNTAQFGSPRNLQNKLFLDFDGRNDYAQSTAILGGLSNASLMAWINLNSLFSTAGVIVGQDNFQIRITNDRKLEAVVNGTPYIFNTALNVSQWYNVAVVYGGGNLKLFLNGKLVVTQPLSGSIAADASLLTLGKNPTTSTQYFKGKIDEIRVFNTALTDLQLQRMVYQEIQNFGGDIRGEIVPKNIGTAPGSLPFTNLLRYYRMDNYKDDIIDDLTTPAIDVTGTKIYNHKNIYIQQAPLPFVTERSGDFATAVNHSTNQVRGQDIMDNDYSIVKVKHDITETSNAVALGMIVDSGITVTMNNDTKIQNDWYLKLDGEINLAGMSQLVQTTESDLDITSSGLIKRNQQGQLNKFNYNYWSAPVSPINTTANNTNYSVKGIMKNGTTATPSDIIFINGYDGTTTPTLSLARYWLYKFESNTDEYANWIPFTENDALRVGQGFTLKGAGEVGNATLNYTFVGKPNNGTISTNTVAANQLLLVGNPYPSAIDAVKFLDDNTSVNRNATDGTLYFWQHAPENNTHVLADYLGSYGVLNYSGGAAAMVPSLNIGAGTATKIPNQCIPVGQGFFIYGSATGGTIEFNNSQRIFVKETNTASTGSNTLFRTKSNTKTTATNNSEDIVSEATYKKIRLGYNTSNQYHRQVLLAFMEDRATSGIDNGYDAESLDYFPNDMYFLNGETQLIIQGEGYFDSNAIYRIGVKTVEEGLVSFALDGLENFETDQPIFIYDKLTDTYNDIRTKKYETNLTVGTHDDRFSLRFVDKTLKVEQNTIADGIIIKHFKNENMLVINNNLLDVKAEKVTLISMLGQTIANWEIKNQDQHTIQIPIKNLSSGVYIVKLNTNKGTINKKIIVN